MNTQPRRPSPASDRRLQRTIVLQLLRDDHPRKWSPTELATELDVDEDLVRAAVHALRDDGLVCEGGEEVWASRATQRLDELALLAI
jgi:predicted transcriptional regulator